MTGSCGRGETELSTEIDFPPGFLALCHSERIGELPTEFQAMKSQAGEDPNHTFPLRDVDVQYRVECRRGSEVRCLGSLSYGQLLREAYPGAVYYYQTQAFRVIRILPSRRLVEVRPERRYTTNPISTPTLVYPNLSEGNIHRGQRRGDLLVVECNLQIHESVCGYWERRGPNEAKEKYPLDWGSGLSFDRDRFTRNYFTSGVLLHHPALDADGVKVSRSEDPPRGVPADRPLRAIGHRVLGDDRHREDRRPFAKGTRFVAIYDQTYGSLRLTSRIAETDLLVRLLRRAVELAVDETFEIDGPTLEALRRMAASASGPAEDLKPEQSDAAVPGDGTVQEVILPGSVGLDISQNNEEFAVEDVFYNPQLMGLAYRGRHASERGRRWSEATVIVPARNILEIPGVSRTGYYNFETGQVEPKAPDEPPSAAQVA